MNDYLKHYRCKITALSPIYIGGGNKISKKEYIYIPRNHQVIIPDTEKMYSAICRKGRGNEFLDYILDDRGPSLALGDWMRKNGFVEKDFASWKFYEMDAGEAFLSPDKRKRPKEIEAFVKDAYHLPYIPGSSIKGMFRTALLAWEMQKNPGKYARARRTLNANINTTGKVHRNSFLSKNIKDIESQTFGTLSIENGTDAVKDNMRGIHIGDSAPIPLTQLTLCQKIDYSLNGIQNPLPILRESLIPGTEIFFDVTIDSTLSPYCIEDIIEAINLFHQISDTYFYSRFQKTRPEQNIVWLGGGCGFLSKTILYPLYEEDAVPVVDQVYRKTLNEKVYNNHKHYKDLRLGIAPHVCKCTKYQGRLYNIGKGRIEYEEM